MDYKIIRISEEPSYAKTAAAWFHEKWKIPESAYLESMNAAAKGLPYPEWYIALSDEKIVGGCGIIENDFHERTDLFPNLCALYVEREYRCRGIAKELLKFASDDMAARGILTLYLVTDHTSFYERYGWEFLLSVKECGSDNMTRMYRKIRSEATRG